MNIGRLDLAKRLIANVRTARRTVYVAPGGDDGGPGSEASPFATIHHAANTAEPGDLVLVADGTYGYTHVQGYQGDPENWLVIMAKPGHSAVQVTVPPPSDNALNVTGSSYVALLGLEVFGNQDNINTNGSGISVYGGSHHVMVWGCHVHDFPGGGINCFDVEGSHDVLDISYNVVHGTSKYSPNNTSGISIHGSRDLTGQTWDGRYANRVIGNYVYDVECVVPYTPGGFDVVTDGNAVSIDDLQTRHAYAKPTLVAGNLLVGCGGRAVHVHGSVNVEVYFNSGVGNMHTHSPAIAGRSHFDGDTDESNVFAHNLICARHPVETPDTCSTWRDNFELVGDEALAGLGEDASWDRLNEVSPETFRLREKSFKNKGFSVIAAQ